MNDSDLDLKADRAPRVAPGPWHLSAPSFRVRTRRHRSAGEYIITAALWATLLYFLIPLVWLLLSSTKTASDLYSTFGLSPGHHFALWDNIGSVFQYEKGIFSRWILNSLIYAGVGATGATLFATMCGYALARYEFFGRGILTVIILGAVMVPLTALTLPLYLLFSKAHLINTPWAVILPSLVNPFGVFLISVYARVAIDESTLEAARLDGAGEFRTLFTISIRILAPAVATVFLFSAVACWNNYFLPLVMLSSQQLFPLTVGLAQWQSLSLSTNGAVGTSTATLVLTGSVLSVLPLIATFITLQRFWVSGLSAGSVKG